MEIRIKKSGFFCMYGDDYGAIKRYKDSEANIFEVLMSVYAEQLDTVFRFVIVYALIICLFILNTVDLALPISGSIEIPMMFMVIYYWSIYRPTLLPPWLIFMVGITFDSVSGMPLGLNAFLFLGLRWLVVEQRLFLMGQSFFMVWIVFCVASFACSALSWGLYGLVHLNWPPFVPVLFMTLISAFVFPIVGMLLHFTHRLLPSSESQFGVIITK